MGAPRACGGRGKGKADATASTPWVSQVDLPKFLAKWRLRSYPDSKGRPMFSNGPAASAFTSDSLRRMLDGDCCELLRRPVMGLNLAAASIDGAGLFAPILQEKLPAVAAILQKEPLGEAIRYFNLSRDVERGRDESMQMGQTLLKHVRRTVRHEQPLLAEAAEAAAALYLGLMALMELGAAAEDLAWWGERVPEKTKQSKHLQSWLKDVSDENKLLRAIAHGIQTDERKNTRRLHEFGALDAADSQSSAELSTDTDKVRSGSSTKQKAKASRKTSRKSAGKKKSTSTKDKNKKRAKGKKARKPETTDSSNDKSSAEKKAAQKSAKASKRSRSSSSESASPPAKGEKPKREQKTARSSTPEPAGPAAIRKSLVAAWSLAEIQAFEAKAQEQTVAADGAAPGKRLPVTPWHDPNFGALVYFPIRAGYCSTVAKVQRDEFPFIVAYLDVPGLPAVGYTALSRVRTAKDYLLGGNLTPEHFTPVTMR